MSSATENTSTTVAPRIVMYGRAFNLWFLRVECRKQEKLAQKATKGWFRQCHRLISLKECTRTAFFAEQSLDLNEQFLKDIKYKLLHECVKEVVRVQRALERYKSKIEAAFDEEKELDAIWWAEKRDQTEGN
ncbi:hypothetical protein A1F97_02017 [Pyrenophora tritici-repentis]|uniref:Uncharacterized protein n=2 Tax=Pyrenophora tritici-repentis TaxID=45151 RepID=A0A2W1GDY7_9PLEO|nr:uncharacterized protein PTRG_10725 [Pyrenophora tritici-repentis Pt-1C-BFP]KAF7450632.1 hypothetical protein A1F99_052480 [Pyrenophora tritici-repentis]EDU43775.1 predicted protein [Pyrenophora tritici-repentis Pt-1C-BFP]KAF7573251.1 hypothetical protein PtrM4_081560 [Pyrenophora tritici-repentis]KAI1516409.1 hypothetical protein Ptr86124_004946 [Pyrenophora tritici-repentis]KAI1671373.1 hypothetical protein L13192_04730 [Pyrenophora tritici-repentis]